MCDIIALTISHGCYHIACYYYICYYKYISMRNVILTGKAFLHYITLKRTDTQCECTSNAILTGEALLSSPVKDINE